MTPAISLTGLSRRYRDAARPRRRHSPDRRAFDHRADRSQRCRQDHAAADHRGTGVRHRRHRPGARLEPGGERGDPAQRRPGPRGSGVPSVPGTPRAGGGVVVLSELERRARARSLWRASNFRRIDGWSVSRAACALLLGAVIGLAARAEVTLFDEPYAGLDAVARRVFYDRLLGDYAEHPRTVLRVHASDRRGFGPARAGGHSRPRAGSCSMPAPTRPAARSRG